jgi:hypothetical protein
MKAETYCDLDNLGRLASSLGGEAFGSFVDNGVTERRSPPLRQKNTSLPPT